MVLSHLPNPLVIQWHSKLFERSALSFRRSIRYPFERSAPTGRGRTSKAASNINRICFLISKVQVRGVFICPKTTCAVLVMLAFDPQLTAQLDLNVSADPLLYPAIGLS